MLFSSEPTRTEVDFAAHVQRTVSSDHSVEQWPFVTNNLDIRCAETLVRYVLARKLQRRFK